MAVLPEGLVGRKTVEIGRPGVPINDSAVLEIEYKADHRLHEMSRAAQLFVGRKKTLFGPFALGDVAEDQHNACDPAAILNRRSTVIDRNVAAVARDEPGMVG